VSGAQAGRAPHLPAVDRVLGWPAIAALTAAHGRAAVLAAVRAELAALRAPRGGGAGAALAVGLAEASEAALASAITARVEAARAPSLRKVFNLTGTVLHTNLGRAPLPPQALAAIEAAAAGATNLEFDLASGRRGDRDDHVEAALRRLTGAAAASVVNNNAAALMLVLNTLGLRRDVLVSRGELIEIGGGFRLPDIMARAGCRLREVGTTNRTHLADYANALGPKTALILKVHASNYEVRGFTAAPDERELAALAKTRGVPFVVDLGSGALVDLARFGLPHEPTPDEALRRGADLVTFSGDKLLGGPQAGLVVGRADLIAKVAKNPMKRAMRCDKLTLAALGAVLQLYADPDRLADQLPALRLLSRPASEIEALTRRLQAPVAAWLEGRAEVEVVAVQSQIGSGSLPVDLLPSFALQISPRGAKRASGRALDAITAALRGLATPVIGRIANGAILLDLRCLESGAQEAAFQALFEPALRLASAS
jgi:L-seryl-tRNA(Ser) seleniumtransferase